MTAAEIEALGGYYGATPRPDDFESFWQARMAEADAVPLHYTVTQAQGGARAGTAATFWTCGSPAWQVRTPIYAKVSAPAPRASPMPLVLQFHGYPGASRTFAEQASFAGHGHGADRHGLPRPGRLQRGRRRLFGHHRVRAHRRRAGRPGRSGMYYVRLHQNIRILCRLVRQLHGDRHCAGSSSTAAPRAAGWGWPVRR